ncbi:MAG: CD1871A family CXXC motif-containing protein [Eubacteriales bacterium]|nr:CD1871A family CXXC motif-containing protein [Fenollaria sp.]MDD7339818.1 CD1871A family CXXC motif-containing protein [Eubacteriales bacterium]MDY3105906.1 CD1871A family CXXC motif-containing protein [Fenollaria sp.]
MKKKKVTQYVFLAMAIAFLFIGVKRLDYLTVFKKAANICFECIGLG